MRNAMAVVLLIALALAIVHSAQARVYYDQLDEDYQYRTPSHNMKRNRMCLLNAGLSQGCDLSDILLAKTQANKFMSFAGPGK